MPLTASMKKERGITPAWQASFGRRKGRGVSDLQRELIDTVLPTIEINSSPPCKTEIEQLVKDAQAKQMPIELEIGFGYGEHLAARAGQHTNRLFIGCEPYLRGAATCLETLHEENLSNIRLFIEDARYLIEHMPDQSISRIFVLFPDPWPKKRHEKRRLLSPETLHMFARILVDDGVVRFASDHQDYVDHALSSFHSCPEFDCIYSNEGDPHRCPTDWITTRYEQKARRRHSPIHIVDYRLTTC